MTDQKTLQRNSRYYERNKEKILAQKKKYREENKERDLENKREYYRKNAERLKQYQREFRQRDDYSEKHAVHTKRYREKLKNIVFDHYGRKCACCGETEVGFLSIDHINGGGNQHRKEITKGHRAGGVPFYNWIIKNNFPDSFQVLCMNCNWGRAYNNGVCPHQKKD